MNRRASAFFPVLAVVAIASVPFWWRLVFPPAPVAAAAPIALSRTVIPDPPTNEGLEVALLRAGVSAESLAAVGAAAQSVSSLIDAAESHWAQGAGALAAADAAYGTAKPACDCARRLIESGRATQEDITEYQTQSAAVATASAAQQAALDALFEATTASLSSDQRTLLQRIHAARSWGLPREFSVLERSETAWVELRSALAGERFATKYGEEMQSEAQALLAVTRADQAVAAAKTGIDTHLVTISAAWQSALEG